MIISIVGSGRMAVALATVWNKLGHEVAIGSRDPNTARRRVPEGITVTDVFSALSPAEVIVLAQNYAAVEVFCKEHAQMLRDKVVIDITNPLDHLADNRQAGAEITAAAIGHDARVVAAFKTNFAATIASPRNVKGEVRDVLYAGDDAAGKDVVRMLITSMGFRPVDCGALHEARIIDGMVPLLIALDRATGGNGHTSWKFLDE